MELGYLVDIFREWVSMGKLENEELENEEQLLMF